MLYEDDVVEAVAEFLRVHGYSVEQRAFATEPGIDLVARRSTAPRRYGQPFNGNQAVSHVGRAVLTAMKAASSPQRDVRGAIALPRNPLHERVIRPVLPALGKCAIAVFWVDSDRSVTVEGHWPV